MGKAENLRSKKKKGRPSLSDVRHRENHKFASTSTRRNPNSNSESPPPEFVGDDDDDERKEKKVKLVVRLPESNNQHQHLPNSSSGNWASESDPDGDNREASVKKRKINAVNRRSTDVVLDQEEKGQKGTDTQGSPLVFGPTAPLPDKKLLVFILDRLQKKDTYGVFAEPVDPNELPDYHEIIEHPMDFGTVRKKLDGGLYSNLEELEADVILICSNAMEYNAPDTIYFRQARSIQDLAKRDFGNLRREGDDGEPQPKVVRRGRPPSKNMKKPLESSPVDCVAPELSSGATHASGEDKAIGSNSYNLRKATPFYRFHSTDASLGHRSRNGESCSEWSIDWNQEFPAAILRADMKYGKKHFSVVDENKRYTYKQVQPSLSGNESSLFSNANGDVKQLSAVGLHSEPHAYARSLARFAANLGPVAWKVASKKLQHVLPPGVEFGPGWVGEGGGPPPPQASLHSNEQQNSSNSLASDHHSSRPVTPPAPSSHSAAAGVASEAMIEAVRRLNSQNEMVGQRGMSSWTTPGSSSSSQAQQQPLFYPPYRNGINGVLGNDLPTHMVDRAKLGTPKMHTRLQDGSVPSHMIGMVSGSDASSSSLPAPRSHLSSMGKNLPESDTRLSGESGQHRQCFPVPPDLNVKVQPPGSPSSGLQIGSSQQPDLALQL
ncbi:PREDICTED: bromodomain-containing protein 9-like [Ipomoea nil]|uniref:bromodomain-containing protein 9-like n=1 Tax=Ipomoea nil TaxID=35883 RepID=UPI000901FB0A|nr:PREDICTED: bromodomain-containing protein 9-like [Ipomoea nil]